MFPLKQAFALMPAFLSFILINQSNTTFPTLTGEFFGGELLAEEANQSRTFHFTPDIFFLSMGL